MKTKYERALVFFTTLYKGRHHIPGPEGEKIKPFGEGWYVNHYGDLSTYDFDLLTRLVFLAHDFCMRASIQQSGPRMVKIVIWQREKRNGRFYEKHPSIEAALDKHRFIYPADTFFKIGENN